MNSKASIIFIIYSMVLLYGCRENRDSPPKTLSLEETNLIIKSAPKKDTIYVDSTGHTWYVYVKPSGMVVILSEEDTTERQPKRDSIH